MDPTSPYYLSSKKTVTSVLKMLPEAISFFFPHSLKSIFLILSLPRAQTRRALQMQ